MNNNLVRRKNGLLRSLKTFLYFIAAISLGLTLAACGSAIKRPNVEVTEVRLAGIDREAAQFTVLLRVSNPNPLDITLADLQADLSIAGQPVGRAESLSSKTTLSANASVTMPMRVVVPFKTLPAALRQSIAAIGIGSLPYKISGSATVLNGVLQVPFEKSGEIAARR